VYAHNLESDIAVALSDIAAAHRGVAIGSYPRFGDKAHRLVVTLESRDDDALTLAVDAVRGILDTVQVDGP
jgi:molybdopterin-biosynthesis enzyme MoeA-like protein